MIVFALVVIVMLQTAPATPPATAVQPPVSEAPPQAKPVGADDLKDLPKATTYTTLKGLPEDTAPEKIPDGVIVRPKSLTAVYAEPGGEPTAALPAKQLGGPTWVPVVESRPGWVRVLLPSRPNKLTGWLPDQGLERAQTSHVVRVDLGNRKMTVEENGRETGSWSVAIGKKGTPTPTGRTYILALLEPKRVTYSPLIIPLGSHSETLETYGGGPGTVGFHGWKNKGVFGKAVSHGCVRVPADALEALSQIPLGSPILIT